MKIGILAVNTWRGLLHNRLILLVSGIFAGVLLLMLAPLSAMRHNAGAVGTGGLTFLEFILGALSGFGSLLAVWASADAVHREMQSGTVLAVLARPLTRWEFLVGKFAGVQMLMGAYVAFMMGFAYSAARLGGVSLTTPWWALIFYPLIRYGLYSAMAILFATRMRATFATACVFAVMVVAGLVNGAVSVLPEWLNRALYAMVPSTGLLAESRFFSLMQGSTRAFGWRDHVTVLAYGLDTTVVLLLAAAALFRRRGLSRL